MYDLRNHGESDLGTCPWVSWGPEEAKDVIASVDYISHHPQYEDAGHTKSTQALVDELDRLGDFPHHQAELVAGCARQDVAPQHDAVPVVVVARDVDGDPGVWHHGGHHVKAVPGRKTDVKDCEWLADLLAHGLIRGSFIPPSQFENSAKSHATASRWSETEPPRSTASKRCLKQRTSNSRASQAT